MEKFINNVLLTTLLIFLFSMIASVYWFIKQLL